MLRRVFVSSALLLASSLFAQQPDECAAPRELLKRATVVLERDERVRAVGERPRVIRVACEERDKDARAVAVAYLVDYATGAGAEATFSLADFRAIEVRRMPGRPQSSEEEREEARAVIRERMRVPEGHAIEGGFVVDPPDGARPGRYLLFLIAPRARHVPKQEVIVDLTRRTVTPRRTIEVTR